MLLTSFKKVPYGVLRILLITLRNAGLMRLRISYFSVDTFGNEDYNIGKSKRKIYVLDF